ncbi:MAG: VCBS repeat-containing protein [Mailhella sp.]|nr:VCBS repeat-containing protein [Mailhella sp.]
MSRRFLPVVWAFAFMLLMMQAAAQAATYLVAPFHISGAQGYSYLGQALPSMLTSRLYAQGSFEPVPGQDAALKEKAPASREAAAALAKKYHADYVVWGGGTIMGDQASIDASALQPSGKVWKKSAVSPVNGLISGVQSVADGVNSEVFGRSDAGRSSYAPSGRPASAGAMNGAFVMNETKNRGAGEAYLNPSLRYQGTEDSLSQIRTQMLEFECLGADVFDLTGDGRSEAILLEKNFVRVYSLRNGNRLDQLAEYRVPASMRPVLVRGYRQGGHRYIVLTGFNEDERSASSQILEYAGGRISVAVKNVGRYLNVVSVPPTYGPMIIGQDSDRSKCVSGPVYECLLQNGRLSKGGRLSNLPKEATVFNFVWLPGDRGKKGGDHLALIADNETLLTFDSRGKRLAGTQDSYSGSSVYVIGDRGLVGLGVDTSTDSEVLHYVPMHMPVVDLDRDGRWELLVNKPVTTAGKIFSNYRTYPQGEIHALLWDGMGMELLWKTRRIKGTVCDVHVGDLNSDGMPELIVAVNSYGGMTSGLKTRCALYMYPLDQRRVGAKPNWSE